MYINNVILRDEKERERRIYDIIRAIYTTTYSCEELFSQNYTSNRIE